jgi:predicted MPP superfamily phosphohydrolase
VGPAILGSLGRRAAAPAAIRSRQRSIALPRLPARCDGLRVLHVSDPHLHPRNDIRSAIIARAAAASPDVVAVTGDLVAGWRGLPLARDLLAQLAARWPTYVVPGNADRWADRFDRHIRRWAETGAVVLMNRGQPLRASDDAFWIAGVDDPHRYRDDPRRALAQAPPEAFKLLLAHSPEVVEHRGALAADLILTGHTHGGQVRLPGVGALLTRSRLGRRWAHGVHRRGGAVVIVTAGIGTTRLGVRFWCPPEMDLWVLRRRRIAETPGGAGL